MRGIIHFHSTYSDDSNTSIEKIIEIAKIENLEFLFLTDHNSIDGSIALREKIKSENLSIFVPIAAEYKTEVGDLIALFIDAEISDMSFSEFIKNVRKQGGLILLPHPFIGHPLEKLEEIASNCDLIEIYNQRCTKNHDSRCMNLALKTSIPFYFGNDAHLSSEIPNVIMEIDSDPNTEDVKMALLQGRIRPLTTRKSKKTNMIFSSMIRSIKNRNIKSLIVNLFRIIINTVLYKRNTLN